MLAEQTNALTKFDITEAAIAELKQKYGSMTIAGIDDKAGLQEVNRARITVKNKRVAIDKRRKELTEQARKWQDEVNAAGKKLMTPLIEIEAHLQAEEDKIEEEKARIRQEKEAAEHKKVYSRIQRLYQLGMIFDGRFYALPLLSEHESRSNSMAHSALVEVSDDLFDKFVEQVTIIANEEKSRLAEIERQKGIDAELLEAQRLAESTRLETVRKEQEAIRIAQEAKETELRAAQKKLDDEKAAIEADKKRAEQERFNAEQLEIAKRDAAHKALEEERARQEAHRIKEQQKNERAAAELARQEALRPDKEKLKQWGLQIQELANNKPKINDEIARGLADGIAQKLEDIGTYLIDCVKE